MEQVTGEIEEYKSEASREAQGEAHKHVVSESTYNFLKIKVTA